MSVSSFSIILVEPQGPLNIGSVCRAMANFGFDDLRLVNPQTDHLSEDARRMAVKATPLLENATVLPSLAAALADCHFAMAATRRIGGYREDFCYPDQAAQELLPLCTCGRVGLVFGREDHGLFNSELDLCQRLITIPTADELRSMNLAQAVSLCLYEIYKAKQAFICHVPVKKLASSVQLEAMLQHMRQCMVGVKYLNFQNPEHIVRTYRHIFGRAQLDEREVRTLQGLWSHIEWLTGREKDDGHPNENSGNSINSSTDSSQ
jgi:tRNA/rRNA methyltransferase